jgi:hypothetical protein
MKIFRGIALAVRRELESKSRVRGSLSANLTEFCTQPSETAKPNRISTSSKRSRARRSSRGRMENRCT